MRLSLNLSASANAKSRDATDPVYIAGINRIVNQNFATESDCSYL